MEFDKGIEKNEGFARTEISEVNRLPEFLNGKSEVNRLPNSMSAFQENERKIPKSPEEYNRPYIRIEVRNEIMENAPKNKMGQFLDANTGLPIEGTPDIGHKTGHEFRREAKKAFDDGLSQGEFNDRMNDAKYYQLEDPHSNRSHRYEDKSPV